MGVYFEEVFDISVFNIMEKKVKNRFVNKKKTMLYLLKKTRFSVSNMTRRKIWKRVIFEFYNF